MGRDCPFFPVSSYRPNAGRSSPLFCVHPSEGHGIVFPDLAGEVDGHGEQPCSGKDLPGPIALIEADPDREAAIGSEAAGDRDQAQRHAASFKPLFGRKNLVGAPENEDQDRGCDF